MKLLITYFAILALSPVAATAIKKLPAQEVSVSFQVFYDNLNPYGQWVNYNGYGYAWVPTVGIDFVPYSTGGHWVLTDYGWTWVSNYDWGWAPFHYGRWDFDDYYGWLWIPDYEWGPAWVSWRRCPGYYGWAPLGPNISVNIAIGGGYQAPYERWTFVQEGYIGRRDLNNYYGPRRDNEKYFKTSTVINNTYVDNSRHSTYIAGPKKEEVEKTIGVPVNKVAVRENAKPGQSLKGNELALYRPAISKENNNAIRPSKIADKKDVTPVSERKVTENPSNKKNEPSPTNSGRSNPVPQTDHQKQNVQPVPQQKRQDNPVQQVKPNQSPKVIRNEQQQPANNRTTPQQHQRNQPPQQNPDRQNPAPSQERHQNVPNNQPQQHNPPPQQQPNPVRQNPNQERHQNVPNNQPQQHNPPPQQQPNPIRQNPMPNPNQERHQDAPPAPQPMPAPPPQRMEPHSPRH